MRQGVVSVLRDLARPRGRERRGLTLAEGVRLVEEALAARVAVRGAAVAPALEGTPRGRALKGALEGAGVPLHACDDAELAALATTEHPQGVVAAVALPAWTPDDVRPRAGAPVLVLDGVQDPGNVGAIWRSALALGAAGLVALPGTADFANPKVVRASMGACFRCPAAALPADDLAPWVTRRAAVLWAAAMDGEPIRRVAAEGRLAAVALAVGNEGAGLSAAVTAAAARRVAIPLAPGAESLNVGVAAAILLHELHAAG